MRKLDPDKHALQRQAIIAAAKICFARNGFHRTSTEAICKEAAISSGKLFHYFADKKAIILAVVVDQTEETTLWLETLRGRSDLSAALFECLDTILGIAADRQAHRLIMEIAAEAARDDDVRQHNAKGEKALMAGVASLLSQALARGQIRPLVPVTHIVQFLMVLIDGTFSRVAVDAGFDPVAERRSLHIIVGKVLGIGIDQADV